MGKNQFYYDFSIYTELALSTLIPLCIVLQSSWNLKWLITWLITWLIMWLVAMNMECGTQSATYLYQLSFSLFLLYPRHSACDYWDVPTSIAVIVHVFYYYFVHTHIHHCGHGGVSTIVSGWFYFSTMWILGIELRSPRKAPLPTVLVYSIFLSSNTMTKSNFRRKGCIWLTCPSHGSSLWNTKAGSQVETWQQELRKTPTEKYGLMVFSWFAR